MPKSIIPLLILISFFVGCTSNQVNAEQEEWQALFNGTDLTGWEIKISGFALDSNYNETFVVEDSMIRVRYDTYEAFDTEFGHLYYEKPFSHYRLRFDYRFVGEQLTGGATWNIRNSGVMLHSQSAASNEFGQHFPVSVELQLLGGLHDGERTTANVCTPGTAVVMGDTINYTHCIPSQSATYHGDQWVHAEAVVLGGESMTFVVEGDTVLRFKSPQISRGFTAEWSEGKDWRNFGIVRDSALWREKVGTILEEGYIALQAESHPIDFKHIELLNLCGCMDQEAINYKTYYLKHEPTSCVYE